MVRSDYTLQTKLIFYINLCRVSISAGTWCVPFFSLPALFYLPLFQSKSITRKGGRALRHFPCVPHAALQQNVHRTGSGFLTPPKGCLVLLGLCDAATVCSCIIPCHWCLHSHQWAEQSQHTGSGSGMCIAGFPARLGLILVSLPQKREEHILGRQNGLQSVPCRKLSPEKFFKGRSV